MTTNLTTVEPDDQLGSAKRLLDDGDIHHLPVVQNGKLVGIVSSADFLKLYLLDKGADAISQASIGQIMQTDPLVLEPDASLRDAATKLSIGGYHALPVVEADRTLIGIVTTSDIVDHLLHQLPRGDGSIMPETESAASPGEFDDSEIMREASDALARGGSERKLAQALLRCHERNRHMQNVCKAAELYLRSGLGEHEHSVLVQRLATLQK